MVSKKNTAKEIILSSADGSANENVTWFWVNRGGFPLDDVTWIRLWRHVCKLHPRGDRLAAEIRNSAMLKEVPIIQPPFFTKNQTPEEKLDAVQHYLSSLQYNHTGTQFFDIRKEKPISSMVNDARIMIKECLPIKCLEAVILAIYLTHPLDEIDRFTIGFKTKLGDTVHKHVILGVSCNGRFGALGLSRRDELMYKPLIFNSLGELLEEFICCYQSILHRVKRITLSQFLPHNPLSFEAIQWKYTAIDCRSLSATEVRREADRHVRKVRSDNFSITPPRRTSQPVFSKNNKVGINGNITSARMSEFHLIRGPVSLSNGFLGGV